MNKLLVDILVCPLHRDGMLKYNEQKKEFICNVCQKHYKVIKINGIEIPDFLIAKQNWKRGKRGLKSNLLKKLQTSKFISEEVTDHDKLILDVGCGENPRGNINIDCYVPKRIPINFVLANAEYLPFKKNSVDIVRNYYNLEHLLNPALFIKDVCEISRQNVEIVTDNSEWIGDIFFRMLGDGRIFHDEHHYKWSVEYLGNLVKRLGYKRSKVYLLNLSPSLIVRLSSYFGCIPRLGNLFYRDLKLEIRK